MAALTSTDEDLYSEIAAEEQPVKAAKYWDLVFSGGEGGDELQPTEWLLNVTSASFSISSILSPIRTRPKRILELGCGDSGLGEMLFEHFNSENDPSAAPASVTCLDISSSAIRKLTEKKESRLCPRNPLASENLVYMVGNALSLPPSFESSFDLVIDKGCLDTFKFRSKTNVGESLEQRVISEILSALKPGGCYICVSARRRIVSLKVQVGGVWEMGERSMIGSQGGKRESGGGACDADSDRKEIAWIHYRHKSYKSIPLLPNDDGIPDLCPTCGEAWVEEGGGKREKRRRKWGNHVKWCATNGGETKKGRDSEEKPPNAGQQQKADPTLDDPTLFWEAWSQNKMYCQTHERYDQHGKLIKCNCFEGVGSVM